MTDSQVARALARALTGEDLPVGSVDAEALAGELALLGWDAERLHQLRSERMAAQQAWPFVVDVEVQRAFGFARFAARLAQLRELLGASGKVEVPPAPTRPMNADERRLAADRPPHWG